jgi:hypothetical protein
MATEVKQSVVHTHTHTHTHAHTRTAARLRFSAFLPQAVATSVKRLGTNPDLIQFYCKCPSALCRLSPFLSVLEGPQGTWYPSGSSFLDCMYPASKTM